MKESFWHARWANNEIAFHEGQANQLLVAHFNIFNLPQGSRIFLPLCGKTRDIAWLLDKGYRVVGAELSEVAIKALFNELGVEPKISKVGSSIRYHAPDLDIYEGNIFDLTADILGRVDGIYDRAALVALPSDLREQYTTHLQNISNKAPQMLITFEYDQKLLDGPPFSVDEANVKHYYGENYQLQQLETLELAGGLKGKVAARETIWLLKP